MLVESLEAIKLFELLFYFLFSGPPNEAAQMAYIQNEPVFISKTILVYPAAFIPKGPGYKHLIEYLYLSIPISY